jgi:hypothetical protein
MPIPLILLSFPFVPFRRYLTTQLCFSLHLVDPLRTAGVAALSPPTTPAADDAAAPWRREADLRPPMGRDPSEKPQGFEDLLPDWVGYGALYIVSIAPVLIVVAVVAILWANSLR